VIDSNHILGEVCIPVFTLVVAVCTLASTGILVCTLASTLLWLGKLSSGILESRLDRE
jgi:hypothetical protein